MLGRWLIAAQTALWYAPLHWLLGCDLCNEEPPRRVRDAAVWWPAPPDAGSRRAPDASPRICARRVTLTERVRSFYDVAEATATAKLATYSWPPAQKGTIA